MTTTILARGVKSVGKEGNSGLKGRRRVTCLFRGVLLQKKERTVADCTILGKGGVEKKHRHMEKRESPGGGRTAQDPRASSLLRGKRLTSKKSPEEGKIGKEISVGGGRKKLLSGSSAK